MYYDRMADDGYWLLRTQADALGKNLHEILKSILREATTVSQGTQDVLLFNTPVAVEVQNELVPFVHGLHLDDERVMVLSWNRYYPLRQGYVPRRDTMGGPVGNFVWLDQIGLDIPLKLLSIIKLSHPVHKSAPAWRMYNKGEADEIIRKNG